MLFPTLDFALFFIFVYVAAWLITGNVARKWFLVAASFFFYGYWDYRFTLLLLQCALSNHFIGVRLSKTEDPKKRQAWMALAVIVNVTVLCFFKYFGFFVESMNDVMLSFGLNREIPVMEILLPVGISFFTFHGISYIVDVYRQKINGDRPMVDVLLYISFFPQLVAGPIVRAHRFMPQLESTRDTRHVNTAFAFTLIAFGLIKKSFIAHYLSNELVAPVFADPFAYSSLDLMFAAYGYAMQIYCDFSAYTDIGIGVAALFGYHFDQNFNQPYRAVSLQDFWRRWHMSLSQWLRDYLYIPLGGSKTGRFRSYRNLFLTMLIGGLWHGAAWNFIFWGVLHGTYLGMEKFVRETFQKFSFKPGVWSHYAGLFLTFHFVTLTWIFFASSTFKVATDYLAAIVKNSALTSQLATPFTATLVFGTLAAQFLPKDLNMNLAKYFESLPLAAQGLALGATLVILSAIGPQGILPFIYFQF